MPIEITGAHPPEYRLRPGDVIMVHKELVDKQTRQPFWWKHFGVVVDVLFGTHLQYLRLDERPQKRATTIRLLPDITQRVWYLPDEEWPDGVHAFRTKLILEGKLDDVV